MYHLIGGAVNNHLNHTGQDVPNILWTGAWQAAVGWFVQIMLDSGLTNRPFTQQ